MNILMALYDSIDNAKAADSKLKDNGFAKEDLHLAVYESEARPGESAEIKAGPSSVSGGEIQGEIADNESQRFMKQLSDWGVPEKDTQRYAEAVRHGSALIVANVPDDKTDTAKNILNRYNLAEIRVFSLVTGHPVEEAASLGQESVNVARPITDADLDKAFQKQSVEGTKTGEEAVAATQANTTEEMAVHKDVEERPETIRDTVGQTGVQAEDRPGGQMRGIRDISAFTTDFHNHYDMVYSTRGYNYSYYEPAYRYGYALAGADRYRGKKWSEIEPDAQRSWDRTNPQAPWSNFSDAVRHAWERVTSQTSDIGPETRAGFTGTAGEEGKSTGLNETR